MPEPTIDLLKISESSFEYLFYNVLGDLILKYNSHPQIMKSYYIFKPIENLNLDNSHLQIYNCSSLNIYAYFDIFYSDFYNYNWIISLIQKYESLDEDYSSFYKKFGTVKYSMAYIVELVIFEFKKHIISI